MLNDSQVKRSKPKYKTYLLRDDSGLYFESRHCGVKILAASIL